MDNRTKTGIKSYDRNDKSNIKANSMTILKPPNLPSGGQI